MKTTEIRRVFLEYFKDNEHEIVPSSSLVPGNDPTLLFTNSGMVQFKDVFLGLDKRPYNRAATAQRCVRAGGKHNDLENVGYTARHHTFFEMLGNFSFGDYFKQQAIRYAWDLLTQYFKLPPEKLWVTVYTDDDEAADIWLNDIGVEKEKFARISGSDNFWQMGDTGPCGPCTEIFYDHGPSVEGGPPGSPDQDGDRYVEIWNLVFMQFNRDEEGALHPLPKPSVDTGMGLERLATVLQGFHNNYDIDLFQSLIKDAAQILNVSDPENKSLRVIADHIRSTSFLIVDGVTPSNEGRGYVLRRIIRRAIRHGYQLGHKQAFFHKLVGALVEEMGDAYPELKQAQSRVEQTLKAEGERFAETLEQGIKILDQEIASLTVDTIPGEVVFRLYDTYGFPADLTADVARERGLQVDTEGFESELEKQRLRSRESSLFEGIQFRDEVSTEVIRATKFVGYDEIKTTSKILNLYKNNQPVDTIAAGDDAIIVLEQTPFYAESGGQVGDAGKITATDTIFEVTDTQYIAGKMIGHIGRLRLGQMNVNDKVVVEVVSDRREATKLNHSATHLLHAALKNVLGSHVQQKGSLVEATRLRFDFSHTQQMSPQEIAEVERMVNTEIRANNEVSPRIMQLDAAKAAGAEALFGEKYDNDVRVISMGDFSLELCGGTHVSRTGDIGLFKIISESGIASGVRRIEAVTGQGALDYLSAQLEILDDTARVLKSGREEIPEKVNQLLTRNRKFEREVQNLHGKLAAGASSGGAVDEKDINGVKVITMRQDGVDVKSLRAMMDRLRDKVGSGVVVLVSATDSKVGLIAGITKDLTETLHAGNLIKAISPIVDGSGGGRADMAQGGGSNTGAIDQALRAACEYIRERTNKT